MQAKMNPNHADPRIEPPPDRSFSRHDLSIVVTSRVTSGVFPAASLNPREFQWMQTNSCTLPTWPANC